MTELNKVHQEAAKLISEAEHHATQIVGIYDQLRQMNKDARSMGTNYRNFTAGDGKQLDALAQVFRACEQWYKWQRFV